MQLLFRHLATYNQWMNRKLYNAAAVLSDEQLTQDRGAFFGSIWATLNSQNGLHIMKDEPSSWSSGWSSTLLCILE